MPLLPTDTVLIQQNEQVVHSEQQYSSPASLFSKGNVNSLCIPNSAHDKTVFLTDVFGVVQAHVMPCTHVISTETHCLTIHTKVRICIHTHQHTHTHVPLLLTTYFMYSKLRQIKQQPIMPVNTNTHYSI